MKPVFTISDKGVTLPVLAFGRGWLAVDKPFGLSVHNNPGHDLCAIVAGYLASDPNDTRDQLFVEAGYGAHPVHRIDRDTSGLVVLGLRRDTVSFLADQFEKRRVLKRYTALLHGRLPADSSGRGVWDRPLTPKAEGRKDPAGRGKKVACKTEFTIKGYSEHYTLIDCHPVTGRKHQIRRHAKLSGNPVVGDRRYGSPRSIKFLESECSFNRLALHSSGLTILTPDSHDPITISSETPVEILRLYENDRGEG